MGVDPDGAPRKPGRASAVTLALPDAPAHHVLTVFVPVCVLATALCSHFADVGPRVLPGRALPGPPPKRLGADLVPEARQLGPEVEEERREEGEGQQNRRAPPRDRAGVRLVRLALRQGKRVAAFGVVVHAVVQVRLSLVVARRVRGIASVGFGTKRQVATARFVGVAVVRDLDGA